MFSAIQSRPRVSQAIATGLHTSGSEAKVVTRNPSGTRKPAAASAGGIGLVATGFVLAWTGKSSPQAAIDALERNARKIRQQDSRWFMASSRALRPVGRRPHIIGFGFFGRH